MHIGAFNNQQRSIQSPGGAAASSRVKGLFTEAKTCFSCFFLTFFLTGVLIMNYKNYVNYDLITSLQQRWNLESELEQAEAGSSK